MERKMLELKAEEAGFTRSNKKNEWKASKRGIQIILTIDEQEKFPKYTTPTELIVNSAIMHFTGFDTALKASQLMLNYASMERPTS